MNPAAAAPARRRPRILYLMHVDWRWVKQRPHHLAEGLNGWADLLVLFRPARGRSRLPANPSRVRRWPLLPIPSRSRWLGWLDAPLQRLWVGLAAAWFRPDLVWVTFPTLAAYLPRRLWHRGVVYDCMDLAEGFGGTPGHLRRVRALEERLAREARLVLCSSQNLEAGLRARYPGARPVLVR
ncbi:MAG TPA: glycosyltransferase, partial [Deinococcales bacterium]|nr:glycosyltransferase [Deinococcales bacterium]